MGDSNIKLKGYILASDCMLLKFVYFSQKYKSGHLRDTISSKLHVTVTTLSTYQNPWSGQ